MPLGPPQGAVLEPLATPWVVLGCLGALLEDDGKRSMALAIGDWSFSSVSKHEWEVKMAGWSWGVLGRLFHLSWLLMALVSAILLQLGALCLHLVTR